MSSSPSRLTIARSAPASGLVLSGEIDAHTAEDLVAAIDQLGTGNDVTLDLSRVEFIDSSGLRVLITAHTTLADYSHRLLLLGPSPAVVRLFEITGLTEHLHFG